MFSPLFWFVLVVSIFGVFTSDSWLMVWVWLEVNALSVIPLIVGPGFSLQDSSSSINYFLVQACGSFLILVSGVVLVLTVSSGFLLDFLFSLGVAVKLGLSPVHFWVVSVSRSLVWWKIMLLLVVQKLAPLWLVYLVGSGVLLGWLGAFSVLVGSLGVVNSLGVKELFAFSSVSNTGWLVLAVLLSSSAGLVYMFCYFFVSFVAVLCFGGIGLGATFGVASFSSWYAVSVWLGFLSFMGLPPFLGFAGKLSILLPGVWSSILVLACLVVGVLVASAGYLTASIGALFMALGAGSWLHGFRPTLLLVGLLVVLLSFSVLGGLVFFLL